MPWNMWKLDIGIVPHPTMPIRSAKSSSYHFNDYPGFGRTRVRDLGNGGKGLEGFVKDGFHLFFGVVVS
jgi:hypothetical protein